MVNDLSALGMQLAPAAHPEMFMIRLSGGVFVLCGLLLIAYELYIRHLGAESAGWPATEGRVTRSKTTSIGPIPPFVWLRAHQASVTYRFVVDGRTYRSRSIAANGSPLFWDKRSAQKIVDEYREGTKVMAHYDPKHPYRSVLRPGTSGVGSLSFKLLTGVGVLIFLAGLYMLSA